ncbi:MAG: ribokinase [Propionibacteriaceae bacterium]|nr:ribokinase [Propionibacteriaceae bacterium]
MPRIAVVGSMNADLSVRTQRLPGPGETVLGSELELSPGGKSSNQAAMAARLGGDVGLFALVGDDAHGAFVVRAAQDAGVRTEWIQVEAGTVTGTAMIAVDEAGENTIIVSPGANARLSPEKYAAGFDILDDARILCLCLEIDQATVLAAAEDAAARGVRVILNPSPFAPVDPALLKAADILVLNEHEVADLTGSADLVEHDLVEALAQIGVDAAVITLGSAGAWVVSHGDVAQVRCPSVSVVDTTGAGDAFTGALGFRLAEGDDLLTAARFAVSVASFTTTRRGAQRSYPTASEVREWLGDS